MAIVCAAGWDGNSANNLWSNHESSLSDTEMIALAGDILNLGQMNALPPGAAQGFKDLATSLQTGNVTITKGIHQRDSKVHFDVTGSVGTWGTYHVFVTPGANETVASPKIMAGWGIKPAHVGRTVDRSLFKYNISGLSYRVGGVDSLYPAIFTLTTELEKPLGRDRRSSFSLGNSQIAVTRAEMSAII